MVLKHFTIKNKLNSNEDSNTGNEEQKLQGIQKTKNTMTKVCPFLSVINSNVNELNILVKRHRLAEWIKTHDPTIC